MSTQSKGSQRVCSFRICK